MPTHAQTPTTPPLPEGWRFALEVHPPGWRFPTGSSWIAGWVWAGPGRAVTDLRAWIDHRPFLGLHGLPRPGLDETLPGPSRPPCAGFSFLLTPHAGASQLRLEARDLDGHWHDLFSTPIEAAAAATPAPPAPALAPLLGEALPDLLRLRIRYPDTPWARLAHEVLATRLAAPLDSLPNPPFVGALEEPRVEGRVRHGRLSVTGWLTHRTAAIRRLTAVLDPLREVEVPHGLPRSDLGTEFPDLAGRTDVAFCAQVDLPSGLARPVQLKLFAELEDGEKHLAFAQRFTPGPPPGHVLPRPRVVAWERLRATLALIGAARALRMSTADAWPAARSALPPAPRAAARARSDRSSAAPPRRVLVATHNLNFEGAPRLVCELMRFFGRSTGASLHVVSPTEGPMRRLFEEAGMTVEVLPLAEALAAPDPAAFHARLAQAARTLDLATFDLVVANTMVSFWAVHLAEQAGLPAVLYVHESAPIERLFAPLVSPGLYPAIEDAFRLARRVIFTAEASRQIFERLDAGHFRVLPSWLDVAGIERFAATHAPADLRAKHGLPADAVVVLNLGTVCERKGQHVFIQAARLLEEEWRAHPPPQPVVFLLVGAREDDFLREIHTQIAAAGLERVRIVGETRENLDFHRLADLLVCTSFEESSPRVLLEAATFGTPIVTTDVNGIPEIVTGREAWLVEPGDPYHLAAALRQAFAAHQAGDRRRAERARRKVTAVHDERVSLPRHLQAILAARTAPRTANSQRRALD